MPDSDPDPGAKSSNTQPDTDSNIPAWQRPTDAEAQDPAAVEATAQDAMVDEEEKLSIAKRFLDDEHVKTATRERKVEFLKGKGFSDAEVQKVLAEAGEDHNTQSSETQSPSSSQQQSPYSTTNLNTTSPDRPPVVTYPEFLTKPQRPPPLVTTSRVINTLYAAAGLSTLMYGTSKYILAPMVEALTESRADLHAVASDKLSSLVTQLESTVSELPSTYGSKASAAAAAGLEGSDIDMASDDDPSEMFHRDVGTQTSEPPSPELKTPDAPEWQRQADRLTRLSRSLTELKDGVRSQSDDMTDVKMVMDVFRDELDALTFAGRMDYPDGFDMYNRGKKNEPDDEIRKARDNIRRVKGVLLMTRNFPAATT